jgi:ribosomal protein S18 acetylase RimI-like enzyme
MTIRIVEASGPEQLDQVRTLLRAYAVEFAGSIAEALCLQGFESELAALPGRYGPPSGRLLLAIDGDRPVGCVGLRDLGEGACEMKRLYVAEAGRGRGLGRQLVETLIEQARQAGYARMRLDTTPDMTTAQDLYRSIGFVPTPRYYDDPYHGAVFFELDLQTSRPVE